jgi:hypothetical protein
MSIIADIQRRSAHIYWPDGIVPEQADLFARNEVVIAAPPGKIWHHLIRPTAWPEWYSNASDVTVNAPGGLLGAGVTFDWTTFGARIHSSVHEFEPMASIGWYGQTGQWLGYHSWLLEPRDEGTTYVSWKRQAPALIRRDSPAPIPAICTAVTICGTSASSSSAKRRRRTPDRPVPLAARRDRRRGCSECSRTATILLDQH